MTFVCCSKELVKIFPIVFWDSDHVSIKVIALRHLIGKENLDFGDFEYIYCGPELSYVRQT